MNTPPTCEQLRQAYELMAARNHELHSMTFAQAMAHDVWARVIDCRARAIRAAQYRATTTRRVRLVRRFNPASGTWHTQRVAGAFDESQPLILPA
jgi:hypothetical protein